MLTITKEKLDNEFIPGNGIIDWHEFTNILDDHQVNPEIVLEVGTLEKTKQSLKYLQTQNIYPFNIAQCARTKNGLLGRYHQRGRF